MCNRIEVMAKFWWKRDVHVTILHISNCPKARISHPPKFSHRTPIIYVNNKERKNFYKHFEVGPLHCGTVLAFG